MEEFLKHFKDHSRAEQRWLSAVFEAVKQQLHPLIDASLGLSVARLSLAVVSKVQTAVGFVSLSELIRDQRSACCSSLSWSSAHYREQAKGAEQKLPGYKALPRDNLLLIGFLCDGQATGTSDGVWRVRDAGGSVACVMLKSSCLWLGRLMLFPSWNYIPHNAPAAGYLELLEPPLCVILETMAFDPGGALSEIMSVTRAAELLRQRCEDQVYVSVSGQVSVVCPLLVIRGKRFFCLILSEGASSVSVFIKEAKHQYWRQCVCVGQSVWISSLRVCSLQGLEGRRVLTDSCQSRLHPHLQLQDNSEDPDTHTDSLTADSRTADTHLCSAAASGSGPAARVKRSTLISFKGMVTKILNAEAGLYEIDGQVGLCLAYQPAQKWGGGLRPGVEIQLHNVHFMYRASPFAPHVVLCACLRSSLQITAFSCLSSKVEVSGSHGPLQCLLLEKNLGASQYLWLCYCQNAVTERLCPRWVKAEREPHQCPVTTFCVWWPSAALWSVRQLSDWMRREVWASLSLASLLPPSAAHMTAVELNAALSWSVHEVPLTDVSPEPLLLVGVLELDSTRATLQLRDQTHALDCLCVTTHQSGTRNTHLNTAWQGCLVCVRRCTLVMERFMKTHFPSWKHLDQPSYITHKHCRLYLQLCVDDLTIISPSAAMSHHLMDDRHTDREKPRKATESAKRPRADEAADAPASKRPLTSPPCVSLLLRLESKQGVTLQNSSTDAPILQPGFVCRAACLGDVQLWKEDPKNHRTQERERHGDGQKIELHFMGSCVRWFPVLHPGCVYRIIARNTEDVSVLKAKGVSPRGGVTQLSSPTLLLQPQWRIHLITEELPDAQSGVPALMSVSEVLHSSSAPEIVCFYGVITKRITLQEDNGTNAKIQSLTTAKDESIEQDLQVRLTIQDAECPGHVIDVYLDLSCGPYTIGLIAGATVSICHLQRRVSKACNVYCRSLPISCVSVTDLTSVRSRSVTPSPPPMMLLGEWASGRVQRCVLAQVKGHVVCVLSLRLQWTCSLCGSIFRQTSCGRTHPPCDSTSAVFQAEAKVVVEDGSAESQVWFSSDTVCDLLMLNGSQWEGLQRHAKVKGHVKVYTRGRNMMSDEDPGDALVQYLNCLCSSSAVCRPIHLTCRLRAQRTGKSQLRKVHRGQTEFICKFTPALQLHCQHIHKH
ncbi:hypothetical protein QQF64_020206 [Cirrhinus molitorella]|uniref:CST complex subunit CTC1 n=1 Tax=Cirrhinus molitorella TaxID=172907 RepID=A0ABR3L8F4_9TELE